MSCAIAGADPKIAILGKALPAREFQMTNAGMGVIRKNNTRNRILHLIRERGKISKSELQQKTRYSMTTILSVIADLLRERLIRYAEKGKSSSGRKPTYFSLNPEGGYFIGISFDAMIMSGAVLDYCGEIIHFFRIPLEESKLSVDYVLECLTDNLQKTLKEFNDKKDRIIGIGIGVPGYLDEKTGVSIFYPHIPNWKNVDMPAYLKRVFPNTNIYIENSTNGMALAYRWLRPEYKGLCYIIITIITGVRMACVFGDVLYKGKNYTAGEIGHIRVNGSRRYCPCGKLGCLESEISEKAIKERIFEGIKANRFTKIWEMAEKKAENINTGLFIEGVKTGDRDCIILLDEICKFLGESIAQLLNILNPDKVILSTKLNQIGEPFLERLRTEISENAIFVSLQNFSLEATDFGDTLSAVGAAAIVMDYELSYVDAII
jgi:predicted NBD/HSP70 family sugar kinase